MSKRIKKTALVRLMFALEHHAKGIKPTVDTLLYALAASGRAIRWGSLRGGANSWYMDVMTDKGKKRFHFRYRMNPSRIDVKLHPYRQSVFMSLKDDRDVVRFVSAL